MEVISPSSRFIDKGPKREEYAETGFPRHWTVDDDTAQTVTMCELADNAYQVRGSMPLDWVLNSEPSTYLS